jgi:hypothetical protein
MDFIRNHIGISQQELIGESGVGHMEQTEPLRPQRMTATWNDSFFIFINVLSLKALIDSKKLRDFTQIFPDDCVN